MKLKNQTKLLQMCYEKNIKIAELEQKLETERSSRIALVNKIADLEAQIEKMKNCKNCANYMISGKCPGFYKTGWCKNWEMTKGVRI